MHLTLSGLVIYGLLVKEKICHALHKKEFKGHWSHGPIYMVSRIYLTKIEPWEKNHQVFFRY